MKLAVLHAVLVVFHCQVLGQYVLHAGAEPQDVLRSGEVQSAILLGWGEMHHILHRGGYKTTFSRPRDVVCARPARTTAVVKVVICGARLARSSVAVALLCFACRNKTTNWDQE